jgi:hypothetical protein
MYNQYYATGNRCNSILKSTCPQIDLLRNEYNKVPELKICLLIYAVDIIFLKSDRRSCTSHRIFHAFSRIDAIMQYYIMFECLYSDSTGSIFIIKNHRYSDQI